MPTARLPLQQNALSPFQSTLFDSIHSNLILSSDDNAALQSPIMDRNDISLDEAFTDSINLTDGPVAIMAGAFVAFIVLLVVLKKVTTEMDAAIEKVLQDFESSLRRYYPKRWAKLEANQLQGLQGEERDIKLLQVMEQLQKDEPEFMTKLANRSRKSGSTDDNDDDDDDDNNNTDDESQQK